MEVRGSQERLQNQAFWDISRSYETCLVADGGCCLRCRGPGLVGSYTLPLPMSPVFPSGEVLTDDCCATEAGDFAWNVLHTCRVSTLPQSLGRTKLIFTGGTYPSFLAGHRERISVGKYRNAGKSQEPQPPSSSSFLRQFPVVRRAENNRGALESASYLSLPVTRFSWYASFLVRLWPSHDVDERLLVKASIHTCRLVSSSFALDPIEQEEALSARERVTLLRHLGK
ncbi:uncharacterized protein B0T23DRAFT_389843 [Neurospora hispaniola]|uniref:Uncharacterized protein n=1 Tax=Neurospora hispaniola TaxID=588809 RepID=A0AAJ0HYB4_9PEZI|nr:hypothetical protein B0T23DRAFT_389843 [Neurospora hispaniola]